MSPRIAKELRPLWLPWALAATAAIGHLVVRPGSAYFHGAMGAFVVGLAGFGFVAGVLVLAAMPMGSELHERTLTLLLSQPVPRERLWKEKLAAASLMIASLGIIHAAAIAVMGKFNLMLTLCGVAFCVSAICSVGFHTLATRSVLVGIASAVGLPYALTLGAFLIAHYLFEFELHLGENEMLVLVIVASFIYSVFCLRISQRQFVNLQLKDGAVSRPAEIPAALVPRRLSNLFRCQPTGVTLNLIRKEVCLHKPLFLVSAVFTAAWLLTLLLMLLRPAWNDTCVGILNGLTGTQVVLMVILGGCVALGDDKALGTSAWHLTLPVSARKQWPIKLLAAFTTTIVLAVFLPSLLAGLTLFKAKVGLLAIQPSNLPAITILSLTVFMVSFWSASMTKNTIQAALTCVLAAIGIFFVFGLGHYLQALLFKWSALQGELVATVLTRCQINPSRLTQHSGEFSYELLLMCLIVALATFAQSYFLFRRVQLTGLARMKYAIILAGILLAGSFWCADLYEAVHIYQSQFSNL